LYGWWKAKDEQTILITEGELDCLTAWSQNIPSITSTGGAMSFQEDWTTVLVGKEIIICFDNDEPGANGMVKVLKHLPNAKILFLPDRANMKDISDYVAAGGDLPTLLSSAKHFADISAVREDMINRIATFQSVFFHEAYIKEHTKSSVKYERKTFSNDKITNAKLYPIPNLMEFKQNKAKCPFHNENTGSFTYFPNTNTCYCFGCSKVADSIDIYRHKNGVSFTEAVTRLNELV
jgi:DNA primase